MPDITSITYQKITDSEFGNKRIWIGTARIGDGSKTWPSSGIVALASDFNMGKIDDILFDGGTLLYAFDGTKIDAYTCNSSPSSAKILIKATGSAPNEIVRIMVIGEGGGS